METLEPGILARPLGSYYRGVVVVGGVLYRETRNKLMPPQGG
jgi:hypothetical protein